MNNSTRSLFRLQNIKSSALAGVAAVALLIGFTPVAYAGKITSVPSASTAPNAPGFVPQGFGGWNLENVEIILNGTNSTFSELDGSYIFDIDSDFTYQGNVDDGSGNITGLVLAKDWPVGEPSGIKIVNDDLAVNDPKATNCIMATSYLEEHFLDSVDPQQVVCSSPFQSHKRYKLAMLPTTVAGGSGLEQGIDVVFNVEAEAGSRDYQVFQKINNWTDVRLEGFKIEVGTGIGSEFIAASDEVNGVGVENLSISVPEDIWQANQLAIFSSGLFGPVDTQHDRPAGFFDPVDRAGFAIAEYPNLSGETDTLTSAGTLGSDYAEIPAGATDQFGPWLPNNMLPYGIFWDDDGNPATDATLLAWYGFNPVVNGLGWMGGAADNFAAIPDATIAEWGENLEYTDGEIDDLVNVGLNYNVTIGDVTDFGGSFTIRITPAVDTSGAGVPAYVGATASPALRFDSSDGAVAISPSPEFVTGSLLTARVGDADLNLDPAAADEVDVLVETSTGLSATLTLVEQGDDRGVFAATLPEAFGEVPVDTIVTMSYIDADDGIGGIDVVKTSATTAVDEDVPPPVINVSITDFSAPDTMFVGQTRKVSATFTNANDADAPASGVFSIEGNGVEIFTQDFTDLAPNKKIKVSTKWTAPDDTDMVWTASVKIDGEIVDTASETTDVSIKQGKNNNNGNN